MKRDLPSNKKERFIMHKSIKNMDSRSKLLTNAFVEGFKDGFIRTVTDEKILFTSLAGSAVLCASDVINGHYKNAFKLAGTAIGVTGTANGIASGKKRRDDTKIDLYLFAAKRGVRFTDDAE